MKEPKKRRKRRAVWVDEESYLKFEDKAKRRGRTAAQHLREIANEKEG